MENFALGAVEGMERGRTQDQPERARTDSDDGRYKLLNKRIKRILRGFGEHWNWIQRMRRGAFVGISEWIR